ncbi:hypothetical protein, conserved [Babesia ovata]|uniref:6-Cys domain-containing protein n=1 Tax=Babesia ovata TaxID=189622 RepID=A0A2H6K975_9APIC|nr:uncharacterized protein BOVATA_010020 [Babesia ovata]GBE59509.1 hypothetical protein, conserved [Babesia ovata]
MAKFSIRKSLWIFCAIGFQFVAFIHASRCNFDYPHGLLSKNALASCHMSIEDIDSTIVVCPQRVADVEYVWHPQPSADEQDDLKTYVNGDGKLRSVALSDVVRSESGNKLFWIEPTRSQTTLRVNLPRQELFAITENRLIFICGPRDLVLTGELQRRIEHLGDLGQTHKLPWNTSTPLNREVDALEKGLGVFMVYRGIVHQPLQGCGSRPSPLFAANNEVTVDPVTGTRSCVVDPMTTSPIGFVCEGKVEPENCMRSLLGKNGEVVEAPRPRRFWKFENHKPWVLVRYFDDLALPPFSGECRCIDHETGQVKAKIEIRSKNEYVCDIASMVGCNHANQIVEPWCSVVLHPGTTLTIKFPIEDTDMNEDADSSSGLHSLRLGKYSLESEFLPKDLNKLRQLNTPYGVYIYDEVSYHKALVGDALELDASQISKGEVTLIYHVDKPLALLEGLNSFFFENTLKSGNEYVPDKVRSVVNVSFAFTHNYDIVGCDTNPHGLFDPEMSEEYCTTKSKGNGIGEIYECLYQNNGHPSQVGIHCGLDEELLPGNCDYAGYDLYSNGITPFPGSIQKKMPYSIAGLQVFDVGFRNIPVSYACICVDQRGYEKSRLILEHDHQKQYKYGINREDAIHTLLPHTLMPWSELGLSVRGPASPQFHKMHHVPQEPITLHVGSEFVLRCAIQPDVLYGADTSEIQAIWLPYSREYDHYTAIETPEGTQLVRVAHNDSIATTPDGFYVDYNDVVHTVGYKTLIIKSRRGAVLISKDPVHKQHVPMTFVCGKAPKETDVSIVTRKSSARSGSSARYTWHMVQVNVETTDPYMQGCGVTDESDELFKPETPQLYDGDGKPQSGCKIDLHAAREAAFYCPAPYVLDPPNCFSQVAVEGTVKNTGDLSMSLVVSQSNHFAILSFDSSLVGVGETLRQTPPLQCRCVTIKGVVLSTIQIENYYSKY